MTKNPPIISDKSGVFSSFFPLMPEITDKKTIRKRKLRATQLVDIFLGEMFE
jgi:hypothetical protein